MFNAKAKIFLIAAIFSIFTACDGKISNSDNGNNGDGDNNKSLILSPLETSTKNELISLVKKENSNILTPAEELKAKGFIKDYLIKNKEAVSNILNNFQDLIVAKADERINFDMFLQLFDNKSLKKANANLNSLNAYNSLLPVRKLEKEIDDLWNKFKNDENYQHIRDISDKLNLGVTEENIETMQSSTYASNNKGTVVLHDKYRHENKNEYVTFEDLKTGALYRQEIEILLEKYNFTNELKLLKSLNFRKQKHLEEINLSDNKYGYKNFKDLYDDHSELL